jgi:hypothetical protein
MESRARVFGENGAVVKLEDETRLKETIAVWDERIATHDLIVKLFGDHLFDSAGNYAGGIHKARPLHLDLNIMLHGAGVIGLLLLILFYLKLFYKFIILKVKLNLPNERMLLSAFIGMYLSHLFVLLSGGISVMSFNLISYLYMGAILGLFRSARMGTLPEINEKQNISKEPVTNSYLMPLKSKPYIYSVHESKKMDVN